MLNTLDTEEPVIDAFVNNIICSHRIEAGKFGKCFIVILTIERLCCQCDKFSDQVEKRQVNKTRRKES